MNEERNNEIISAAKKHSDKLNSVLSFIQGATWSDEHPNDEVLKLRKIFESDPDAYKQGYKDAIDKSCKWLADNLLHYWSFNTNDTDEFINDFKKYMEEQQ